MANVRFFFRRQGKTVFAPVSVEVYDRVNCAVQHFQQIDPRYSLQRLLTNICVSEEVAPGEGPTEEAIIRWLVDYGF